MFKKSSVSYKVLPEHKKVIRPVVPSIKLVLKNRSTMKVTPDISNSTTYNSKSNSYIAPSRNTHKNRAQTIKSKEIIEISDSLCYEEYKKSEILRSRKFHNSKFPYWFIDSFNDLEMSRSSRQSNSFSLEILNRNNNIALQNWIKVTLI